MAIPKSGKRIDFSNLKTNNNRATFIESESTSPYEIFIRETESDVDNQLLYTIAQRRIEETIGQSPDIETNFNNHLTTVEYDIGSSDFSAMDPQLKSLLQRFAKKEIASLVIIFETVDMALNNKYFKKTGKKIGQKEIYETDFFGEPFWNQMIEYAKAVQCWKVSFLLITEQYEPLRAAKVTYPIWTDDIKTVCDYSNIRGINFEWNHRKDVTI